MDKFFTEIFNTLGKRYEMQVYERSRRMTVAAQRSALRLAVEPLTEADDRLARDIQLTERLMAILAADKN